MTNKYVTQATDILTTYEAKRAGVLEYALRKSEESIPYIDKAKALKLILAERTKKPIDILNIDEIQQACIEAAGVSVKASKNLHKDDIKYILAEFIKKYLETSGENYIDELIYRYLLTSGGALGGKMRNLVGSIANEKLTRCIISQLQILNLPFEFYDKSAKCWINSSKYTIDKVPSVRSICWKLESGLERQIIYNLTVPLIKKNIDIVVLSKQAKVFSGEDYKNLINTPENYVMMGELKGGIDPAGADEHWKTANTALSRARESFAKIKIQMPIIFIGAAIEKSMSKEIFAQYQAGKITNCANLHAENQMNSLCNWLVNYV